MFINQVYNLRKFGADATLQRWGSAIKYFNYVSHSHIKTYVISEWQFGEYIRYQTQMHFILMIFVLEQIAKLPAVIKNSSENLDYYISASKQQLW